MTTPMNSVVRGALLDGLLREVVRVHRDGSETHVGWVVQDRLRPSVRVLRRIGLRTPGPELTRRALEEEWGI